MENGNGKTKNETADNGWSWGANKHAKYDQRSGRQERERARAYDGISGRVSARERATARERERGGRVWWGGEGGEAWWDTLSKPSLNPL